MSRGIVIYATRYGSTQEIAENIANKLDFESKNVMYIDDASELDEYDKIILGSPIYYDDICEEMKRFISSFFIKLGGKKLFTFAVYGATKGRLDIDYATKFANYFNPHPVISVAFLGRATKTSLTEKDYKNLQIFFKNRLESDLSDFDYFDENKVDVVVEKIKEAM
jgi:menaquinone-dependent protoporphyrinogen IX oxidase